MGSDDSVASATRWISFCKLLSLSCCPAACERTSSATSLEGLFFGALSASATFFSCSCNSCAFSCSSRAASLVLPESCWRKDSLPDLNFSLTRADAARASSMAPFSIAAAAFCAASRAASSCSRCSESVSFFAAVFCCASSSSRASAFCSSERRFNSRWAASFSFLSVLVFTLASNSLIRSAISSCRRARALSCVRRSSISLRSLFSFSDFASLLLW